MFFRLNNLDVNISKKYGQGNKSFALFFAFFFLICSCLFLNGCGTKVVLTTGFGKDDVFVIGGTKCTLQEMKVYLSDIEGQYESVYGSGIWDAQLEGITLEQNVKDTVLARIAQIKTMYLLAVSKGVELTEEQKEHATFAANMYYESLSEDQIEYLGITQELVTDMYEEYALANMVYDAVIADVNPEISDDEARSVSVMHIFFATGSRNSEGDYVIYSQDRKAEIFNFALEIKERAENGEDFEALAVEYSDEDTLILSIGREMMDEGIENEVFSLATNEVSSVVETEQGLHLFKCISTLDREETEANKIVLVEKRRQEAFESEYNEFVSGIVKNLNSDLWDEVTLNHDIGISTSFFAIYDQVFQAE